MVASVRVAVCETSDCMMKVMGCSVRQEGKSNAAAGWRDAEMQAERGGEGKRERGENKRVAEGKKGASVVVSMDMVIIVIILHHLFLQLVSSPIAVVQCSWWLSLALSASHSRSQCLF